LAPKDRPGRAFEQVTAAIQARLDPNAKVEHDVILVDRIGNERQFDIVVTGQFGGQQMLGVIECKDTSKPVGTPTVDAFVTKAANVHANFKILVSRKGFTAPALRQCAAQDIQALSLAENDPANRRFFIGTYWDADVSEWQSISLSIHSVEGAAPIDSFKADEVKLGGKRIIDWISNFILDHEVEVTQDGWQLETAVVFREPQVLAISSEEERLCAAITFKAWRHTRELQYRVGLSGEGFLNWHTKMATFPPGTQLVMDPVPMDFSQWEPRDRARRAPGGFVDVFLEGCTVGFERVPDAVALHELGEVCRADDEASHTSDTAAP